jgi:catalase (peroxidase I)
MGAVSEAYVFEGRDRQSGELKWTATEFDLVFGSNSELRAVVEFYALTRVVSALSRISPAPGPR